LIAVPRHGNCRIRECTSSFENKRPIIDESLFSGKETFDRRIRVLCLHGYHGSAAILRKQMQPLFGELRSTVEFIEVDAPSLAAGDFGWWHGNFPSSQREYRGWQRTRDWLIELFDRQGPFDGVFGFSQGAALTGVLPGLRAPDGKVTPRTPLAFDFAIMAGGFRSEAPEHQRLFAVKEGYQLPSLHVMGSADTVVPIADSLTLARQFAAPTVLEHGGGHVIGATPEIRAHVTAFLTCRAENKTSFTQRSN
jgi:predicted esterase